jgi:prepilin signal peptidase PulO-like enzyme (type II secretory pathway)
MAFGIRAEVGRYNPYEKGKLEIGKALRHNLPHFFSLDSVNVFLGKLPSVYLVYVLVLAGAILFLLIRKHYLRALTVLGFTLGYWLLIMVSSPLDARFYTENMLLPLAFIAAVPVVADILPEMKFSYAPALFLIIILIRMGGIYAAHRDYTAHYEVYDPYFKYVKEKKLNGVFVENKLVDQKKAIVTWASGYESILISSLASPDSCRVVQIMEDPKSMEPQLGNDSTLVTIYGFWSRSQLGDRYFKLPGGKYEIITEQP